MNFLKSGSLIALVLLVLLQAGCGYELVRDRSISGGEVVSVSLPVFKNRSLEPQVPAFFTDAFSRELAASGLVEINKPGSDGILQGTINSIMSAPSSLTSSGLAVEKVVTVNVGLTLAKPTGIVRSWAFGDSEAYSVSDINLEDFNKKAALQRIAARMARRFHSQLVADR